MNFHPQMEKVDYSPVAVDTNVVVNWLTFDKYFQFHDRFGENYMIDFKEENGREDFKDDYRACEELRLRGVKPGVVPMVYSEAVHLMPHIIKNRAEEVKYEVLNSDMYYPSCEREMNPRPCQEGRKIANEIEDKMCRCLRLIDVCASDESKNVVHQALMAFDKGVKYAERIPEENDLRIYAELVEMADGGEEVVNFLTCDTGQITFWNSFEEQLGIKPIRPKHLGVDNVC